MSSERLECDGGEGGVCAGATLPWKDQIPIFITCRFTICMAASRQITALAFSPDGRALAAADDEGALAVWDLAQARRSGSVAAAHLGPVWSLAYSQGVGGLLSSGAHAI